MECVKTHRRTTVDIFIDGKPTDISIYATFSYIWGYCLEVEWWDPGKTGKQTMTCMNYRCALDGVPIEKVDMEAWKRERPRHHKLELFSDKAHCRMFINGVETYLLQY